MTRFVTNVPPPSLQKSYPSKTMPLHKQINRYLDSPAICYISIRDNDLVSEVFRFKVEIPHQQHSITAFTRQLHKLTQLARLTESMSIVLITGVMVLGMQLK